VRVPVVCMDVNRGLLRYTKHVDCGFLRTRCWGDGRDFRNRVNRVIKWHRDEQHYNLCSSLTIIMNIIARRSIWSWVLAQFGKTCMCVLGAKTWERLSCRWRDSNTKERERIWRKNTDRIHLTLDSDQWRACLKMVMRLLVPENTGNYLTNGFSRIFLPRSITCHLMRFVANTNSEGQLGGSLRTYFDSPDEYPSKPFFIYWC
jgi:hypothetical protein